MTSVWSALLPVAAVSALVPVQVAVTILLLRSTAGRVAAAAWVAGMTSIRLLQGLVFGLVLSSSASASGETDAAGPALVVSVVLLVLAVLSYAAAAGAWIKDVDPDAPPPKWLGMAATVGPVKAFGAGAGLLLVSAKFWVLTLGAIASIGAAGVSHTSAIADFLVFVVLAESVHLDDPRRRLRGARPGRRTRWMPSRGGSSGTTGSWSSASGWCSAPGSP